MMVQNLRGDGLWNIKSQILFFRYWYIAAYWNTRHWRCGFSDHVGGRHHNAIVLLALPERSEPVEKRKKKDNLDTVDHRDRGGGRAEYPVFGTDVVSGIGLWDYQ